MSKFGDVALVPFPFTSLSGRKIRPAIQLTSSITDDVVICAISTIKHSSYDIMISPNQRNGLKQVSYIRTNKLATIEKRLVLAKLGTLDDKNFEIVKRKIRLLFKV